MVSCWFNSFSSEDRFTLGKQSNSRAAFRLTKPSLSSIKQGLDSVYQKIASLRSCPKKRVLDPQGAFLQKWNKIFVLCCTLAIAVDPLFFYIPVIKADQLCLSLDRKMQTTACVVRSLIDFFYIFHIILQFHTGFIAPSSRVFGRGELVEDSKAIAKRYLLSYFIIDILSILPLPQVVTLVGRHIVIGPISHVTKELLKVVIFIQYIPRTWRIYPLYKEVTVTSGLFTETAWSGAAFNLFLYMLASHVLGAFWYLFAIERRDSCWRNACAKNISCNVDDLYCRGSRSDISYLSSSCPLLEQDKLNSTSFDFGIALDALAAGVAEHENFSKKFIYCFWWGLRNLSSLGQNLKTGTFEWEILFAIAISVMGLILFSFLIGNMQKYLQSLTTRVEEMRVKRSDAEHWMAHRMLPEELRGRVRRYEQYKWQENRGVEEESLIRDLPNDLRRDIKRHLCWTLLRKVPMFDKMDEQLLDGLCTRLKPVLYTSESVIVREGDPVEEMLFIMRGTIVTITTNGGKRGFFNAVGLMAGDFCGEELLTWALDPNSPSSLPISTRTVRAVKDVEAFCLMPEDLKSVASQFRRLHSKQLQHTFRFYSQQWRSWGACIIQAAWRRYCRRKMEKAVREAEDGMALHSTLGAAIYASRFATVLPRKPSDPDFTA